MVEGDGGSGSIGLKGGTVATVPAGHNGDKGDPGSLDFKRDGAAIVDGIGCVGGMADALTAGAISGLANSRYTSCPDVAQAPPLNMTVWAHEFSGTGDMQQMLPNIMNERDGMDVYSWKYYFYNNHLYLAKSDMTACGWPPDTEGLWQWELVS